MSDREPTISLVVEAYNLAEGQSLTALDRALGAVGALLATRADCEALLVRSMATAPLDALLARHGAVRVVDVPGAGYDALKDAGALAARGRVVAYLDGDCVPMDAHWLDRLTAPILAGEASATCGVTIYEDTGLPGTLATVLDFGFVLASPGGPVGCYVSNNVAFARELRVAVCPPAGPLRCMCYAHTRQLARLDQPVVCVPQARVWHESPPFFRERLRRGHDLVGACWVDPTLREARWLRHGVLAAPLFYGSELRRDWHRAWRATGVPGLHGWRRVAVMALAPLARLVDMVGIVRALRHGPPAPDDPPEQAPTHQPATGSPSTSLK